MATQTIEHVDSIEHLDHNLVCGTKRHKGSPPRADIWYDQHGCAEGFQCDPCVAYDRARYGAELAKHGAVICFYCRKRTTSFEECVKVVRL